MHQRKGNGFPLASLTMETFAPAAARASAAALRRRSECRRPASDGELSDFLYSLAPGPEIESYNLLGPKWTQKTVMPLFGELCGLLFLTFFGVPNRLASLWWLSLCAFSSWDASWIPSNSAIFRLRLPARDGHPAITRTMSCSFRCRPQVLSKKQSL